MKIIIKSSNTIIIFVLSFCFNINAAETNSPIIIDHTCTDIREIPQHWIEEAKLSLHIAYGHTSHGSQITSGMSGLVAFANNGGKGLSLPQNIFAWNNGGTDGALDLHDYAMGGDVGYYPNWVSNTRNYLGDPDTVSGRGTINSDVNVIMWSWCGQVDSKYASGTLGSEYLDPMTELEEDYPGITFIYMTGHVDIWDDENNKAANQVIRDFCISFDKVLFDFSNIERYDPDGKYFEFVNDNCDYYSAEGERLGNWATEWQNSHTEGVDWYNCSSAHSQPLNANQKAYAVWWMWARLAGWDTIGTAEFRPPAVINPVQDIIIPEDCGNYLVVNDIRNVFSEPDYGDSLSFLAFATSNDLHCSFENYVFLIKPDTNYFGECLVQLIAENRNGHQSIDTFQVIITPINDPPEIIDLPDSLNLESDSTIVLIMNDYVKDIDTQDSLLTWTFQPSNESLLFEYDSLSTQLTLSAPMFGGEVDLTCTVTDDSSASTSDIINIQIELSTVTEEVVNSLVPHYLKLYQNYPNPFNPTTIISFENTKSTHIRIELYNALGQKEDILLNSNFRAGYHEFEYNASDLPSGVYYYRIVSGSFQTIKKMLLLK